MSFTIVLKDGEGQNVTISTTRWTEKLLSNINKQIS